MEVHVEVRKVEDGVVTEFSYSVYAPHILDHPVKGVLEHVGNRWRKIRITEGPHAGKRTRKF